MPYLFWKYCLELPLSPLFLFYDTARSASTSEFTTKEIKEIFLPIFLSIFLPFSFIFLSLFPLFSSSFLPLSFLFSSYLNPFKLYMDGLNGLWPSNASILIYLSRSVWWWDKAKQFQDVFRISLNKKVAIQYRDLAVKPFILFVNSSAVIHAWLIWRFLPIHLQLNSVNSTHFF